MLTSIRQPAERRRHRFSWINEWKETADANGRPFGLELILPDWFYAGVLNDALVLTMMRFADFRVGKPDVVPQRKNLALAGRKPGDGGEHCALVLPDHHRRSKQYVLVVF